MNNGQLNLKRSTPRQRSWVYRVATGLGMLVAFIIVLLFLDALPGFIAPGQGGERSEVSIEPEAKPQAPICATAPVANQPARLAIVIDDWGYPSQYAADFLAMEIPLTVAIIPHEVASQRHLTQALTAGFDVLVHLPMEPGNAQLLTPGMITVEMAEAEVRALTQQALRSLPGVIGVNNHMGSKATADERVTQAVLSVIAEEGLLFLDSRTTSSSVAAVMARQMGIPALENVAFLDGKADVAYIRSQLLSAAKLAQKRGAAVAIGHLRPKTAQALTEVLPELEQAGIELVRISELVSK